MRLLNQQSLTAHTDTLFRAAWVLCGSREDAEDLVQETFARVLARPRMLQGERSDRAYLLRVLRNTFLTGLRDARRPAVTTATLDEATVADPRPRAAPESALQLGELYDTIAGLPERFRLALVAVDLLGLSYREAGDWLDVREETLTTRLFRARRLMARQFSGEPAAEPGPVAVGKGASGGLETQQLAPERRVDRKQQGERSSTRKPMPVTNAVGAARTFNNAPRRKAGQTDGATRGVIR
jgi:RNA polymerase sigma-70 factor (ECF subfamily)